MLHLKKVYKSFGDNTVLAIDDQCLETGIYWLKGVNGSGKSTLLNVLAGLLPFKGDVVLNETIPLHKEPVAYRRLVNYAPAEPVYPSFISGQSLIDFACSLKKGDAGALATVRESLGIGGYLINPAGSYSSGMLKKLSLLMAFAGKPSWILLDEPFTTLDTVSQQALAKLIQAQHAKGVSFIITSHHDPETAHLRFSGVFTVRNQQLQQDQ